MTVKEIIENGELTLSLEVFPPKGKLKQVDVNEILCSLASTHPSWISVTCGAGGDGGVDPINTAQFIDSFGRTPVVHHTCVGSSRTDTAIFLSKMKERHLFNILALRGDISPNGTKDYHRDFVHATDLVKYVKEVNPDFCVGVAAYPDGHYESPCVGRDVTILKTKQDYGADYAVTQLFYDNTSYFRFRELCSHEGVTIPIVPGVMPVFSKKSLERVLSLSKTPVESSLRYIVDKFGYDEEALLSAGIVYTSKQIIDLISNGVRNIHLYTMNRPTIAYRVVSNLAGIFKL